MNSDYEEIEGDLRKKEKSKKKAQKISGRSVFKLKEIIQKKAVVDDEISKEEQNGKQDS